MTDQPDTSKPAPPAEDSLRGFGFAMGAYLMWGFLPIFMKAVAHISPPEVIAHRVLWSLPIAAVVVLATGGGRQLAATVRRPRMLAMAAMMAAIISVNWGIYVWAIGAGHALDAALGYYINPLFSVFLGWLVLRERLSRTQVLALALAAAAVLVLTLDNGQVPVVALSLTLSWGFYALMKRWLPIGANEGFFLEVALLTLPALGYALWLGATGQGHFLAGSATDTALLLACGVVTAGPLIFYANGAKGLRLSTIAMMQYVSPTLILITAVYVFGEHLSRARLVALVMIWAALAIYTLSILWPARRVSA